MFFAAIAPLPLRAATHILRLPAAQTLPGGRRVPARRHRRRFLGTSCVLRSLRGPCPPLRCGTGRSALFVRTKSPVRGTGSPHSRWSRTVTGQAGPRPRRGTARGFTTDIRAGLSALSSAVLPSSRQTRRGTLQGFATNEKFVSPTSMRPAGRRAGRPSACPPCRSPALRRQARLRSRPLPPRSCRCSAPEPVISTRQTALGPHFASLRALWHRQTRRRRTHLPHNSCACETARHHRLDGDFTPRLLALNQAKFPAQKKERSMYINKGQRLTPLSYRLCESWVLLPPSYCPAQDFQQVNRSTNCCE